MRHASLLFALVCCACGQPERRQPLLRHETRTVTAEHGAQVTVEAGTLIVPQRRGQPGSGVYEIPYYRLRSTAASPATPIFLLAGGPGSSWLEQFERQDSFEEVQLYRSVADVVLFDQRGAGRSRPPLRCDGQAQLPLDRPLDTEQVGREMRTLAARCREGLTASGVDLAGLTTIESAADVDALRTALGYRTITLIGGSYGSHLALAVMRRFSDSVERAVLHGVEGPDHTWDDPAAKLATLERIAAAAEASRELRDRVPAGGLLAALATVIARLEVQPVTVTVARGGREVSVVIDATLVRMAAARGAGRRSRAAAWPALILELQRGEYSRLADMAIDLRTLELRPDAPMHFTMDCASGVSSERAARFAADPATALLGDLNFGYRAVCPAWNAPDLGADFRAPVVSSIPTLLVHGTWDLSAPIDNAREVARTLPGSQLVEVVEGHHGALYNLLEHWPAMKPLLVGFLRGEDVRFPPRVELPPVSWAPPPGKP